MATLNVTERLENRFTFQSIKESRHRKTVAKLLTYVTIFIYLFIVLFPIFWMVSTGVKMNKNVAKMPPEFWPADPSFEGYKMIFTQEKIIWTFFKNSFIVAVAVMISNLAFGTLAAYTFSRLHFKLKNTLFNFILGSRLMPVMAVAIPYYVIIQTLGLLDTYLSLILVYLALTMPFTIWFLTLYFNGIPKDLEDAALIDGCSPFQALIRVVVPVAIPGLVAAAAFAFMTSYNEFLFARFLTQTISAQTGPVIIAAIAGNPDASYSLISVCMTLGLIPPLILALSMRRWLTEGLSASITFR